MDGDRHHAKADPWSTDHTDQDQDSAAEPTEAGHARSSGDVFNANAVLAALSRRDTDEDQYDDHEDPAVADTGKDLDAALRDVMSGQNDESGENDEVPADAAEGGDWTVLDAMHSETDENAGQEDSDEDDEVLVPQVCEDEAEVAAEEESVGDELSLHAFTEDEFSEDTDALLAGDEAPDMAVADAETDFAPDHADDEEEEDPVADPDAPPFAETADDAAWLEADETPELAALDEESDFHLPEADLDEDEPASAPADDGFDDEATVDDTDEDTDEEAIFAAPSAIDATDHVFPSIDDPDLPGRKPRIALMGEFSAGKSTLSNLLIGANPLPTRVTATQLPPVWISWGDGQAFREDLDGTTHAIDVDRIGDIDPSETRVIRLFCKSDILELCDLIDMPGISDPNMASEVWERVIGKADGVLWCTHATQAWRQSEAAVWGSLDEALFSKSLLLLTRFDKLLNENDRARVLKRVERETRNLFAARLPISLTGALAAGDDPDKWASSGAAEFTDRLVTLLNDLARSVGSDLGDRLSRPAGGPATTASRPGAGDRGAAAAPVAPRRVVPRRVRPASEDGRTRASL